VVKLSSDGASSTDPLGQAKVTFTSGSLPSGQGASSVQIRATALGGAGPTDTISIVIGGSAGSVVIGQATAFTASENQTTYITPMTVQVADANGNPVSGGTVVSLSAWPTHYSQGGWVKVGSVCVPAINDASSLVDSDGDGNFTNDADAIFPNEDTNENLILDAGEDKAPKIDGILTPANSTAGTLPSSVVTDANGLASFNLTYLKQYAVWIHVRIRASAQVQGSEATGSLLFMLPALKVDADACVLPNSPFN
jgi:hypothetical protein